MSFVKDIFQPAKFLPVAITAEGMETLEAALEQQQQSGTLFVEIGACEESTYELISKVLIEHFQYVFTEALEQECEFIAFSIA